MPVREFVEADIPQVTSLYWNYLSPRKGPFPPQLLSSFAELYFSSPLFDCQSPSFVYQDKSGEVVGFLGITTRRMLLSEQLVRVGFGGNFVVHPKARSGLAAPRLLGAYMSGNHDLLLSDSANDISRHLLERLGFQTIPALNIHWARPLRPVHYAVHALSRGMRPSVSGPVRLAAKPLCLVADSIAGRFLLPSQAEPALHGSELTVETLLHCLLEFGKDYPLRPEYRLESLRWLVSFMERNRKRGNLRRLVLRDDSQKIVGWYIYYADPGAVGEVVQIGGAPAAFRAIIQHLLNDAREHKVIALHGVADFRKIADFSDEGCFFTCRGGWALAYSRRPELIEILESGKVFLSRLDGEWCLDPES